jgi:hypothetical protein
MTPRKDDTLWRDLARPVLIRTSHRWADEDALLRPIAFPDMRLHAAQRLGLVERRRHWLTRRWQIRSAPYFYPPRRVEQPVRGRG